MIRVGNAHIKHHVSGKTDRRKGPVQKDGVRIAHNIKTARGKARQRHAQTGGARVARIEHQHSEGKNTANTTTDYRGEDCT